jgi:hypothetical protein
MWQHAASEHRDVFGVTDDSLPYNYTEQIGSFLKKHWCILAREEGERGRVPIQQMNETGLPAPRTPLLAAYVLPCSPARRASTGATPTCRY